MTHHVNPPDMPSLFDGDIPAMVQIRRKPGDPKQTNAERFQEFHEANPWVYDALVTLARDMKGQGRDRTSIDLLCHVLRWQFQRRTISHDGFKLSNNHTAFYARLIMARCPDLAGIFQLCKQRSA